MKHCVSMFHLMFQCFIFLVFRYKIKTSRDKNQNLPEAISKHARSDASETLKLKLKHPHAMFQLCN